MSYIKRLESETAARKQNKFNESKWKQDIFISDFVQPYTHFKINPNIKSRRDVRKTPFKFKKANIKPFNMDRTLYAISYPPNKE